jgi:hypothetical protein
MGGRPCPPDMGGSNDHPLFILERPPFAGVFLSGSVYNPRKIAYIPKVITVALLDLQKKNDFLPNAS